MSQYVVMALSCVQHAGGPIMPFTIFGRNKSYRNGTPSGFSVEFQFLYIIAYLSKYPFYSTTIETPEEWSATFAFQYHVRKHVFIAIIITFVSSFFVGGYYEKKLNMNWITGGIITSFLLSVDLTNSSKNSVESTFYTFGSYLEFIAWIPQFWLTLEFSFLDVEPRVFQYYVGMFIYDILNVAGLTYDAYVSSLNTSVGFNLYILKFLLCCGIIWNLVLEKLNRTRW